MCEEYMEEDRTPIQEVKRIMEYRQKKISDMAKEMNVEEEELKKVLSKDKIPDLYFEKLPNSLGLTSVFYENIQKNYESKTNRRDRGITQEYIQTEQIKCPICYEIQNEKIEKKIQERPIVLKKKCGNCFAEFSVAYKYLPYVKTM